jgi:hypothetical protein
MEVSVGSNIPLNCQLWDGDPSLYVRATLKNADGSPYGTPFVNLTSVGGGLYLSNAVIMPSIGPVLAVFEVFSDAGYSIPEANHTVVAETYEPASGGSGGTNIITIYGSSPKGNVVQPPLLTSGLVSPNMLTGELVEDDLTTGIFIPQFLIGNVVSPGLLSGEICEGD